MTPLPSFPSAGQELVVPPGSPTMATACGAEIAPPAGTEIPAAFACLLELCTETAVPATAAPIAVMGEPSQPAAGISRPSASPETAAPGDGDLIPPDALPLATTARSLRLELPCAPVEMTGSDDAEPGDIRPDDEEADAPEEVPAEIMGLGVSLPVPMPAPQTPISVGPVRSAAPGPSRDNAVVERQLQSNAGPAPVPPPMPADAPVVPVTPEATGTPAFVAPGETSPVQTDRFFQAAVKNGMESSPGAPLEKIASPARPAADRPVKSLLGGTEYKFLKPDNQEDALSQKQHGTVNAKSSVDMHAAPETTPFPPAPVQSRGEVPVPGAEIAAATAPAVSAGLPLAADVVARREISLPAADAIAVVREVAELTHDFRFHERSSVEVKFNFNDDTELSVRLAYRDGDVLATFRTDSTELRTALGREWQGYAAQVAQDSRGYRMADPVFTSSGDFSGSPQGRDSGSATGGDARNQQQSSNPDQPGSPRAATPAHGFRPQAGAPSVSAPGARVSTDRLLHAFA